MYKGVLLNGNGEEAIRGENAFDTERSSSKVCCGGMAVSSSQSGTLTVTRVAESSIISLFLSSLENSSLEFVGFTMVEEGVPAGEMVEA